MALLDTLSTYSGDVLLDTDPGWHQFVCDHKTYIKSNAQLRQPSAELMTQVAQDLTWYLRYIGITRPIAWIVAYINDLNSDMAFDQSQVLAIPTVGQLEILYQSYITTSQVKK